MHASRRFATVFISALLLTISGLLTGCTLATTAPDAPIPGPGLHGVSYGGGQPIVGQHVYLMAATISGVGSAGYGNASMSLLDSTLTGNSDSIGAYVISDSNGNWGMDTASSGTTTYDYICPSANTQVYVYAVGGNPGSGTNSAATMMAPLGSCGNLSSSTYVVINELTTVAAAYALSGFATDGLHISAPQYATTAMQTANTTDALAQTNLLNAFANVNNLVNTATGAALISTPGGTGVPVAAQVITLGNILASCVNTNGTVMGPTNATNCYTLFNNAGSTGGATGTIPADTATAAINIAHNPYVSSTVMSNLYGLQAASGAPFAGGDTSQPTDFTVAIKFTEGFLHYPWGAAIDSSGNVWFANYASNTISKFSPSGTGSTYTGGGLNSPYGIAIDGSGNVWEANHGNNRISKFSSSGTAISPSSGSSYSGGGLNSPYGIAIDASGNAWVTNNGNSSISEFSSSGTAITSSSGYGLGGLHYPYSVAIDTSGNVWVGSENARISEFSSSGSAISGVSGYYDGGDAYGIAIDGSGNAWVANQGSNNVSKFSSSGSSIFSSGAGGVDNPHGIAIDGSGNAWIPNATNNSISEFSSGGTALSPSSGYTGGGMNEPWCIAVDGSGNVWVGNFGGSGNTMTELVGAATPVVTPIVANLLSPYSSAASKP